ncbi:ATP-dependent zinc metalloprotease FtsH [Striga asiatica]|uniref:ATP-dependent zinc metalloprotease FtsH n=1 Tax=Striga asiatica TaxID=4170 RepID=A0A5A7RF58_STRAF|nr:ATP-dependent zinc metalloprotease FtsH [Striga asiatica]
MGPVLFGRRRFDLVDINGRDVVYARPLLVLATRELSNEVLLGVARDLCREKQFQPMFFFSPRHPLLALVIGTPARRALLPARPVKALQAHIPMATHPLQGKRIITRIPRNRDQPSLDIADIID